MVVDHGEQGADAGHHAHNVALVIQDTDGGVRIADTVLLRDRPLGNKKECQRAVSIGLLMDMEGLDGICLDGKVENDSPACKEVLLAPLMLPLLMAI